MPKACSVHTGWKVSLPVEGKGEAADQGAAQRENAGGMRLLFVSMRLRTHPVSRDGDHEVGGGDDDVAE